VGLFRFLAYLYYLDLTKAYQLSTITNLAAQEPEYNPETKPGVESKGSPEFLKFQASNVFFVIQFHRRFEPLSHSALAPPQTSHWQVQLCLCLLMWHYVCIYHIYTLL